jgi:hypothetical protein
MNQNPALGDQALSEEEVQQRAMALIRAVGPPSAMHCWRASLWEVVSWLGSVSPAIGCSRSTPSRSEAAPRTRRERSVSTAADIPAPIPGTAAERKFNQALDCGFKTLGRAACFWPKQRGRALRSQQRPDSFGGPEDAAVEVRR